jgi:hypothetical protein
VGHPESAKLALGSVGSVEDPQCVRGANHAGSGKSLRRQRKRCIRLDERVHRHAEVINGVAYAVPDEVAGRQQWENLVICGQAAPRFDHAQLAGHGSPVFRLRRDLSESLRCGQLVGL